MTNWLPDEYGLLVFLFFHVPLFAILIALIASTNEKLRYRSRIGVSIFLLFHGFITEHVKNYGEAKIYDDLNIIIRSNIAQLQTFFQIDA